MKKLSALIISLCIFIASSPLYADVGRHLLWKRDKGKYVREYDSNRDNGENGERYFHLDAWSGEWLPLCSLKDEFLKLVDDSSKKHFRVLDDSYFIENLPFVSFKIAGDKLLLFDAKFDERADLLSKQIFSFDKCLEYAGEDYYIFSLSKTINIGHRRAKQSDFSPECLVLSPLRRDGQIRTFSIAFSESGVDEDALQTLVDNKKLNVVLSFDAYKRFEINDLLVKIDEMLLEVDNK